MALRPGRARLSTKPAATGSATPGNTIGTELVACSIAPTVEAAVLRADVPRPSLPREVVLASAPDPALGGFRVPSPGASPDA